MARMPGSIAVSLVDAEELLGFAISALLWYARKTLPLSEGL